MRTLLLGSTGFFGSATARLLVGSDCFGTLVLASRDPSKLNDLSGELGSRAEVISLDMSNEPQLTQAIEKVDLVVNAAGAAMDTAVPAMRAAASAEVPYCDIAAEASVLLQAEPFDEAFRESETTILVGAGFHPGVTDLLGQVAMSTLDDVTSVDFYIVGNFPDYGDAATMLSGLASGWEGSEGLKTIMAGIGLPATIVQDRERKSVEPWNNVQGNQTPDGFDIDFTYFATLEPLALNRRLPEIPNAAIYYGAWPNDINSVLRPASRAFAAGQNSSSDALREIFTSAIQDVKAQPKVHYWAEAKGTNGGKAARCRVYSAEAWATNAHMLSTTTRVLALAAEKLAMGEIQKKGLVTAGDVLNAREVFQHLAQGRDPGVTVDIIY